MQTKSLIIITIFIAAVFAVDDNQIDYTRVIPRQEIPGFWDGRLIKPTDIQKTFTHKFNRGGRIVGGNEADSNAHPYQAGLLLTVHWWTALCGGCLISASHVATAAHCMEDVSSTQVILGAHSIFTVYEPTQVRVTVDPSNYIVHPDYDAQMLYNDIALIKLTKTIELNDFIQPIQLPGSEILFERFAGEIATVSGWGRTNDNSGAVSSVLRYTLNEIKENEACEAIFGNFVIKSTLCTITRDTQSGICNGDSGGPLTVFRDGKLVLIGIVSYGALAGCQLGYPAGFARITYFMPWISQHVDISS